MQSSWVPDPTASPRRSNCLANGAGVCVVEASDSPGGGTRSAELTLPGFVHDVCSAVHPLGILSPYFKTLPLRDYGLEWVRPPASVAHPLDDDPAVMLYKDIARTGESLRQDAAAWSALMAPFLSNPEGLARGHSRAAWHPEPSGG
jgi:phytoene dehydrogenase-like protein